ncbi:hypothetical protein SUGI_0740000 [Cryptomeria japonica]|nr:hypothetical protein SUGI_0740000 [Cryptomeria japonica]
MVLRGNEEDNQMQDGRKTTNDRRHYIEDSSFRRSSCFSRGVSKYRCVSRHHQNGHWEAIIGIVFGNKYLYLGTYKMH